MSDAPLLAVGRAINFGACHGRAGGVVVAFRSTRSHQHARGNRMNTLLHLDVSVCR